MPHQHPCLHQRELQQMKLYNSQLFNHQIRQTLWILIFLFQMLLYPLIQLITLILHSLQQREHLSLIILPCLQQREHPHPLQLHADLSALQQV